MASDAVLNEIDAALDRVCPGKWRRLTALEHQVDPLDLFQAGWEVELDEGAVRAPGVRRLLFTVDPAFPNSQLRCLAPELGSGFVWPHVEKYGLLCMKPTALTEPVSDRLSTHLHDALQLLNLPDEACAKEFEREFGSYWSLRSLQPHERPSVLSLVKPGGQSRQVVFYFDPRLSRILVADTKADAKAWLRNAGAPVGDHDLLPGLLVRLPRPWLPGEFPNTVGDAIRDLPGDAVRATLQPNRRSLFIFEATTATGPVLAAVLASGAKSDKIKNGFRSWAQVPLEHVKRAMVNQKVERLVVSRVDPGWVHGRGHCAELPQLRAARVAIIGCGAIGSEVAALLAKAGVGELTLVDGDDLHAGNLGRHLLGISYIGWRKAQGVAQELQRRLPHLAVAGAYCKKFERLSAPELNQLAQVDLVITAGLDIEGEAVVDRWRQGLARPPAYLSTWVEAYATAGHAVLLYGKDNLMSRFDGERPAFRLTDWPAGAGHLIAEAGCGNVFQPHGATDLQPTISMAARLALDALLGKVPDSCRRVWFGDRDAVGALGGALRPDFAETCAMRQFPW